MSSGSVVAGTTLWFNPQLPWTAASNDVPPFRFHLTAMIVSFANVGARYPGLRGGHLSAVAALPGLSVLDAT